MVDYARNTLNLSGLLSSMPVEKEHWATHKLSQDLEFVIYGYAVGVERVFHMDDLRSDSLIKKKLGLESLPTSSTLYRDLDQFRSEADVNALLDVNSAVVGKVISGDQPIIVDIDTTVETVHGTQEGSCLGYNPNYHGRNSYQPFIAFDGVSKTAICAELRSGKTPSGKEEVSFYSRVKECLKKGSKVTDVRADRGFGNECFMKALDNDGINYTIKIPVIGSIRAALSTIKDWRRVSSNDDVEVVEVGSINYRAKSWSKERRIVAVRKRPGDYGVPRNLSLFEDDDSVYEYQAIVTTRLWDEEDVWHFYNQRCTCENYIKELKGGLGIDRIGKATFFANYADLILKILAYNLLIGMASLLHEEPCGNWSIQRFRRAFLSIPGKLIHHARKCTLYLPEDWRYREQFMKLRTAVDTG